MAELASLAWGNVPYRISQPFTMQGVRPDWYAYSANYGAPKGAHIALDVVTPKGTKIYALNPGRVVQEGFSDSFRPYPVHIIAEDNPSTPINETGYYEIYGHLMQEFVAPGQIVKPGDLIGLSGEQTIKGTTTPDGSGPHIHFELRKPTPGQTPSGYTAVDPTGYLQGREGTELGAMPYDSGLTGALGITEALQEAGKGVTVLARRFVFVLIGAILLYIGATTLLKTHTGVRAPKVGKLVRKAAIKV